MNHKLKLISAIVFFLGQQLLTVFSQESSVAKKAFTEPNHESILQLLASTNVESRVNAAIQLDEWRNRMIKELIAMLKSTNSGVMKIETVIVLGEYRAAEAVPILIEHLDWDDAASGSIFIRGTLRTEEVERAFMPVFFALKKIGMPSIPALLDRLLVIEDGKKLKKWVACCCEIEGIDMTRKRLEDRINHEAKVENKEKFKLALQALNTIKTAEGGVIVADW